MKSFRSRRLGDCSGALPVSGWIADSARLLERRDGEKDHENRKDKANAERERGFGIGGEVGIDLSGFEESRNGENDK